MVFDKPIVQAPYCRNCRNCIYFDAPHPREPANPCCQVRYDSKGYWLEVKPTDWCDLYIKANYETN